MVSLAASKTMAIHMLEFAVAIVKCGIYCPHILRELPLKPQPWSGPVTVQLVGEDKEGVSFQHQLQDKLTPS